MAEDQDQSQKTEEPTARKLEQAREKGQVANSREVGHFMVLFGAALLVLFALPVVATRLMALLQPFIERPHDIGADFTTVRQVFVLVIGGSGLILGLFAVVMMIAALAGQAIQTGFLLSTDPIKPKLEKISLLKGLKRLFSSKSLVEFAKTLVKFAVVGAVVGLLAWPALHDAPAFVTTSVRDFLSQLHYITLILFVGVLSVMVVVAGLDYLFQKMQFLKQMRMSHQDLKDEYKQTEGDPHVKAKIRQLRQERSKKRMMAQVPEATFVLTNPTHYAVALKYEEMTTEAPIVVAKGVDAVALRIREEAKKHDIPIIENPPLCRAIYGSVDLDEEISFEHYKAIAEVISYVYKLQKKTLGGVPKGKGKPPPR